MNINRGDIPITPRKIGIGLSGRQEYQILERIGCAQITLPVFRPGRGFGGGQMLVAVVRKEENADYS
jgi:hypothetical protein